MPPGQDSLSRRILAIGSSGGVQQGPSPFHRWNLRPPCTLDLIVGAAEGMNGRVWRRHDQLPPTSCSTSPPKVCAALERAAEEPTAVTAEAGAPQGTDRWKPSRVPFRTWKPPPKRSRSWMRSFPGCEARASQNQIGDNNRQGERLWRKRILWIVVLATFAGSMVPAQDVSGDWQGKTDADSPIEIRSKNARTSAWLPQNSNRPLKVTCLGMPRSVLLNSPTTVVKAPVPATEILLKGGVKVGWLKRLDTAMVRV
jgi:hypothetical protein